MIFAVTRIGAVATAMAMAVHVLAKARLTFRRARINLRKEEI
jgi:hypothetical protein